MNIIFSDQEFSIGGGYVVLELDRFCVAPDQQAQAWAVVGNLPVHEFPNLEFFKRLHQDMMQGFRNQHWDYVEQSLDQLIGRWNGELDSFYQNIRTRVVSYRANPPAQDWDGTFGDLTHTASPV